MPKVKLFEVYASYDHNDELVHKVEHESGWEVISDEDLKILHEYIKNQYRSHGTKHVLIIENNQEQIKYAVQTELEKIKEEIEKKKLAEIKSEKARKACLKELEAKKLEKKRKQLEKLKQELGVADATTEGGKS